MVTKILNVRLVTQAADIKKPEFKPLFIHF
mgnify:CR=1 FL=1